MISASRDKQVFPLGKVLLAGTSFEPSALPANLRHDAKLGIVHPPCMTAARIHVDEFTCHPRAIRLPGGEYLLLFAAGTMHYGWARKNCVGNAMLSARSSDGGRTWSPPAPAWETPYSQHAPILFLPSDEHRLYCFGTEPRWDVYDGMENAAIGFRTSDDGGRHWSSVTLIRPENDPDFRGMSAMRMCETDDGSWLLGSHTGHWNDGKVFTRQYLLRSENRGRTWTLLPNRSPDGWFLPEWNRLEEGRPIHLGDNRVLLMVRTPEGRLWELRSDDAGRTWTPPRPTALAHPDAPPMLFHLSDGHTLIAFHHNQKQAGSMTHQYRAELWVSLSHDHGHTWTEPRFVLANAAESVRYTGWGGFTPMVSYCDLLVDGDALHLFVDHQVRQVLHLQFRQSDLANLPDRGDLLRKPRIPANSKAEGDRLA